jgi:mono/diheme cytochrome c family protein
MFKPLFAFVALLLLGPSVQQPAGTPVAPGVPSDAAQKINPIKPTPASLDHARKMYGYDCAVCHGALGDGKGDLSAGFKVKVRDFTNPTEMKDLTDGELFYIIKNGKGEMPGEGDRAKDDDLWNMVVLVRSFAKK